MVFVGTAADGGPGSQIGDRVSFRVEEAFKGVKSGATTDIKQGSGRCDISFQPGVKYLVFASHYSGKGLPEASLQSLPAPQAAAELRWLRRRGRPEWKPSLLGLVNDVYSALPASPWKPLVGAEVRLTRDGATFSAMSDSTGVFEFDNLNPGEYQVQASFSSYRLRFQPRTVLVSETCEFPALWMTVDGHIAGKVRSSSGLVPAGIVVELTTKRPRGEYEAPFERVMTTEGGRFLFQGIPPGEYWVSVNSAANPRPNQPHPKVFVDVSLGRNETLSGVSIRVTPTVPAKQ
jgi:hypothetical protein